ncbi:nSTAND1 domain-containing NTPase [Streptomyces phytophilus]|uniref:nSTAND1 domain-containing NTPase n=1 Tax=Streptomyces phytophilus TaxID=722715 RepID=UPI0015F03E6D|nr:helix-turn-helix domain-containing protein [Streptomyces phytophilus]
MGRRERPLDPAAGPTARFAYELRKLRAEAGGITYRDMARKAHYSASTLAQAAAGERLPSLEVVRAYVAACGGDRARWEQTWKRAAAGAAEEEHARADRAGAPYLGLARFEAGDHERFFGRDRLVAELRARVGREGLTVVTGPSGSGKSSLLRAGLIPRLRQAGPGAARPAVIRILTPGEHPARTHAGVLDAEAAPEGTLIVVDQFEEVFTLCTDRAERTRFLDLLCAAAGAGRGIRVVVAVRADFYGYLTHHRDLAAAARAATVLVGPMRPDEVREAIVKPAALGGLVVERALTARLLREVADEPGALPLLSHALLETWRRRRGRVLTEAAYDEAGGLHGAIAHTAERVCRRLTTDQTETARRILLRLVAPGQGTPDTRRPAARTELTAPGTGESAAGAAVLDHLTRARLITLDGDTVNLAHEAVLSAWPRLRDWVDEDRDRLRAQRLLTDAAHTWETLGRDAGALYRGTRLATAAQYFAADRPDDLTGPERQFLHASLAARRRARRGLRTRTAALSVLVVLSLVGALVAWQQNEAAERRDREAEARRLAGVADSLRTSDPRTAMALSLAAWNTAELPETRSALLSAMAQPEQDVFTDPAGGAGTMRHLSLDGRTLVSVGREEAARWDVASERKTDARPGPGTRLDRAGAVAADTGWLPLFAAPGTDEQRVSVLDLATGEEGAAAWPANDGAEMGPSGRSMVTYHHEPGGAGYRIRLHDTGTRRVLLDLRTPSRPEDSDGVWDMSGRQILLNGANVQGRRNKSLPVVSVSTDDRFLAVCTPGRPLEIWDVPEQRRLPAAWTPEMTQRQCLDRQVYFTPDSRRLVVVTDKEIRQWRISSGEQVAVFPHDDVETIGLSEDGSHVAAFDGAEILLWRREQPDAPVLRHSMPGEAVSDLRILPGEGRIRYLAGPAGQWGTAVHTLDLDRALTDEWHGATASALFSSDARNLVTARIDKKDSVARFVLTDVRTGKSTRLPALPCRTTAPYVPVRCEVLLAFSSDGDTLAYGVGESTFGAARPLHVSLWDVPARRVTATPDLKADDTKYEETGLAFGPDDDTLILSEIPEGGATQIWDVSRRKPLRTLPGVNGPLVVRPDGLLFVTTAGQVVTLPAGNPAPGALDPGRNTAHAFSRDGALLAAGDPSGRTALWTGDVTRRLGVLTPEDADAAAHTSALAFAPDGGILAVGLSDGTLQLWDTDTHRPIGQPLPTAGDTLQGLAFSQDGSSLYATGAHTPPQRFDIAPDAAARAVCRRSGGGSTAEGVCG